MTSLTYSAARGSAGRSQRAIAFATIAGLHAIVIVAIVSGFARTTVQRIWDQPITIDFPEKPDPTVVPPPPPANPSFERPDVDTGPLPDIQIDFPSGDSTTAITPVAERPPVPTVTRPVALPIRLVGKHRLPNTDDYYPASEIRNGVEGASTVGVCVDANGKRSSDPTLVQSSGSAKLDEGAKHVLRDGRYARAMQGDQYVSSCYQFRIVFKINNQ
jgi:TonB family protein